MGLLLFGLTGGVASGKSAVAARFAERGLVVIDADQVAREVVEPGTPGLAEVVVRFGSGVLDADGHLDRAALGRVVFADEEERRALNAILHPRIAAATLARRQLLERQGVHLACYEAALLVENGLAEAFRPLVVVAAPEALQRARLMARNGLSAEEASARIAAQLPLADKIAVADHIIHNEGTLEELRAEADRVLAAIRAATSPES